MFKHYNYDFEAATSIHTNRRRTYLLSEIYICYTTVGVQASFLTLCFKVL